jgi:thiol-disulfide isomerase/thioredoxin
MKTLIAIIPILALALLSCGEAEKGAGVSGTLIGADGMVPPLAHVHLLGLGDGVSMSIESVTVDESGTFTLMVPDDRYYDMMITAVNHQSVRIPLPVDEELRLDGIKVRLAPYEYQDPLEEVAIIGDWNDFDRRAAESMVLQDDGTFTYSRIADGDTLAYQLLNVAVGGRSINGTDADYYIYDGGGDYISVLSVKDSIVEVIFDPGEALILSSEGLPSVDFGVKDHPLAEVFEIQIRMETESDNMYLAFLKHYTEHGTVDGFDYDLSGLRTYLMSTMSSGGSPTARRYAAVAMTGLAEMDVALTDDEIQAAEALVPVTDGMWAAYPMGLVYVSKHLYGPEKMIELFEANLDQVTEQKPRAIMLLEIGLMAKDVGDTARAGEIYYNLCENYGDVDVPMFQYRLSSELDPNLKIAKWKEIPDFEVTLLGDQGRISKSELLGKYYLLDFWATWCGPCVGEMSNLHKAYERFKGLNFEMLSVSFDLSEEDVKRFRAEKWDMPWLHAFLEGAFDADLAIEFEVSGIPKPILVDPEGMIVATGMNLRGDNLEKTLAHYLEN